MKTNVKWLKFWTEFYNVDTTLPTWVDKASCPNKREEDAYSHVSFCLCVCLFFIYLIISLLDLILILQFFPHTFNWLPVQRRVRLYPSFFPPIFFFKKKKERGTSLVAQWLRLLLPMWRDAGSIPGQGAKTPHASGPKHSNQSKTKKKTEAIW